ncbi:aminoacyl-tRNA hydrolase [Prolixibacteraceae bacterium JC049]|nr:aminoacyl-tRNA hydrolase [Prolixibacteraceae bacterium JC049]
MDLTTEISFKTSRSSGAGGQHVNKTESRVELRFNVFQSQLLSERQKQLIINRLASRLTANGELILTEQSERSQLQNKEKVLGRFYALIHQSLIPPKKRKATRPTLASKKKRLDNKRIQSEKKQLRRKDF